MREICTSGSVGGEGGNILAYPASSSCETQLFEATVPCSALILRSARTRSWFAHLRTRAHLEG